MSAPPHPVGSCALNYANLRLTFMFCERRSAGLLDIENKKTKRRCEFLNYQKASILKPLFW